MHARGFTAGQKTVENQDRATGPPRPLGRWAVVGRAPRAAGPRTCLKQNPLVTESLHQTQDLIPSEFLLSVFGLGLRSFHLRRS